MVSFYLLRDKMEQSWSYLTPQQQSDEEVFINKYTELPIEKTYLNQEQLLVVIRDFLENPDTERAGLTIATDETEWTIWKPEENKWEIYSLDENYECDSIDCIMKIVSKYNIKDIWLNLGFDLHL